MDVAEQSWSMPGIPDSEPKQKHDFPGILNDPLTLYYRAGHNS